MGAFSPGEGRHILDIGAKCRGRSQRKGWSILSQSSGKINKKFLEKGVSGMSLGKRGGVCLDRRLKMGGRLFRQRDSVRAKAGSYETT